MTDYKNRLIDLCDKITKKFDWDLERETKDMEENGSRRITIDENLRKIVYKAKMEAELNHGLGISTLYDRIEQPDGWGAGWVNMFGYKYASDFTRKEIEDQRDVALIVIDIIELYNDWKENEYKPLMATLSKDGNDFEMPTAVLEAVNKLVLNEKFKLYKYKDTGEVIGQDDVFHMSSVIGFSSDLTMWLEHVKRQEEFLKGQEPNKIFVTMFGKMDDVHPIYSNWLFTLHKGGTVWIVTDQVEFDNPYQKHVRLGRRSIWRDRDEMYDECDLPYDLFHNIEQLRGHNSQLTKSDAYIREPMDFTPVTKSWNKLNEQLDVLNKLYPDKLAALNVEYDIIVPETEDGTFPKVLGAHARKDGRTVAYWHPDEIIIYLRPEVFFKGFNDLKAGQRAFAILLTKEIIQYAAHENVKPEQIMLASEFVANKILIGEEMDPSKPEHVTYWTEESEKIFNELLETIEDGEEKTTALTVRTYDVITKSEHYNASWLSTPEKQQSLTEWTVLDDERRDLYVKVRELGKMRDEAYEWLYKELNDNYHEVAARLMQAKEIQFKTVGYRHASFTTEGRLTNAGCVHPFQNKSVTYRNKGYGIGKLKYDPEYCRGCVDSTIDPKNSKQVKKIDIQHYRELMWLLGYTDRKQLHKYFRQYRHYSLYPYTGNSILDQTHPYLRLKDPCSSDKSNGLSLTFYMCGNCYKKYKQEETLEVIY